MSTKVIGIADCVVSSNETDLLTTYGLGSCIAVALYDPITRVGGLLHFLLPDQAAAEIGRRDNPFVCADTGVPEMIARCVRLGAVKRRLRVYAAGGASVVKGGTFFDVGRRNQASLRKVLSKEGLPLTGEAVGGECWRNMRLDMGSGEVWVKEGGLPEVQLSAGVRW